MTLLISFISIFLFPKFVKSQESYTEITGCTQITEPGEYRLVNDIIDSTASTCINIQADNVILDCQGHIVDGNDTSGSYGIYAYIKTNVTIKNCIVTDWYYGIYFDSSNSNTLSNITANSNYFGIFLYNSNSITLSNITANSNIDGIHLYNSYFNILSDITSNSNSGSGIFLDSSNSNTLSNITANSNYFGIFLYNSNSNTLSNITSNSNERGIYLRESNSNIIKGSMFQNNYYGIYLYNSSMNLIYDNLFNSTSDNVYFGTSGANYWNTTLTSGTNIVGGPYIGGNYWGKPDGTGFSDTCSDSDNDGICDSSYTLATDNIDYLPLAKYVGPLPAPSYTEISSCMQITEPGEYRLVNDIIDSTASTCINIQADNVILDCQGHIVDGVDIWHTYGIYISRDMQTATNITIKNCIVRDWDFGIYLNQANNNTLTNIISNSNTDSGIRIFNSSFNTLSNITLGEQGDGIM